MVDECDRISWSSNGRTYHGKLISLLMEEGTKRMRHFLHLHLPEEKTLNKTIQENHKKLKRLKNRQNLLTDEQWRALFPPDGSEVDINVLDFNLCYTLIRNLAIIDDDIEWDVHPTDDCKRPAHDVIRLVNFRKRLRSKMNTDMSQAEFKINWGYLTSVLHRLGTPDDVIQMYLDKRLDQAVLGRCIAELQEKQADDISTVLSMAQKHKFSNHITALTVLVTGIIITGLILMRGRSHCKDNIQLIQPNERVDQFIAYLPYGGWSARQSKVISEKFDPPYEVPYVIVADTMMPGKIDSTESGCHVLRGIQDNHIDVKGYNTISWNFLIGEDGVVYEGRGWDDIGSHTPGWNHKSYGIAFIGEYNERLPEPGVLTILERLIHYGISKGKVSRNYILLSQCQVQNLPTPGSKLQEQLRRWPNWQSLSDSGILSHCVEPKETLQETLQGKESRRKYFWYAGISCCVSLTVLATILIYVRKNKNAPWKNHIRVVEYSPMGKADRESYKSMPRGGWEAREPKGEVTQFDTLQKLDYVLVCDTSWPGEYYSTAECCKFVRHLQDVHMDSRGWSDIAYNFLIGEDGVVYEGRGWHIVGSHSLGWNQKSYCIAFVGAFKSRAPRKSAMTALEKLLEHGVSKGKVSEHYILHGQCQVRPFDTPGRMLYDEIQKLPHWKPVSNSSWTSQSTSTPASSGPMEQTTAGGKQGFVVSRKQEETSRL